MTYWVIFNEGVPFMSYAEVLIHMISKGVSIYEAFISFCYDEMTALFEEGIGAPRETLEVEGTQRQEGV